MIRGNLVRVSPPSEVPGEMEYWVSEPERLDPDEEEWGFAVYGDKDVFLATFVYPDLEAARAARRAIEPVLKNLTFIATQESC